MQEGGRWDLKVHINGQHTFFLHQRALCAFSGKLRKLVGAKQEKGRKRSHTHQCTTLKLAGFPGGPLGFELVARFCYNDGNIGINPSNVASLHCSATFLEMTEEHHPNSNLLNQTEAYLEEKLFYSDWKDLISALRSCESFLDYANSSGLLERLVSPLHPRISSNSVTPLEPITPIASSSTPDDAFAVVSSSSSSSSSSSFSSSSSCLSSSSIKTPETARQWLTKEWWFEDLTTLHPLAVECIIKRSNAFGDGNKDLVLTRFLLHYLKSRRGDVGLCSGLADTAVHGVVGAITGGATLLSCRFLFWVRRVVGGLGLSNGCRSKLEALMGAVLDRASLDDLLVCGEEAVYDVGLVVRLVGVFVRVAVEGGVGMQGVRKVGRLVDNFLREVSPDPRLDPAEFAELAGILPDSARCCFDGVYRALEIYLESHPKLTFEERSRLCQCLNYEKLTLEACRDLAKNPWIPPREAVQALMSQQSNLTVANSLVFPVPFQGLEGHKKPQRTRGKRRDIDVAVERPLLRVEHAKDALHADERAAAKDG